MWYSGHLKHHFCPFLPLDLLVISLYCGAPKLDVFLINCHLYHCKLCLLLLSYFEIIHFSLEAICLTYHLLTYHLLDVPLLCWTCVCLWGWDESPVGNMELGLVFQSISLLCVFSLMSLVYLQLGWLLIYEELLQPFYLLFSGGSASPFFLMWFCVLWHFGGFYFIFFLHFIFMFCALVLDFVLWLPLCLCKMSHVQ